VRLQEHQPVLRHFVLLAGWAGWTSYPAAQLLCIGRCWTLAPHTRIRPMQTMPWPQ